MKIKNTWKKEKKKDLEKFKFEIMNLICHVIYVISL